MVIQLVSQDTNCFNIAMKFYKLHWKAIKEHGFLDIALDSHSWENKKPRRIMG